jgi:hypothetical protein
MERREIIQALKTRVKDLASTQKAQRILLRKPHDKVKNVGMLQWKTLERRVIITTTLNYYLEARGKDYRHNIRMEHRWLASCHMDQLREDFPIEKGWPKSWKASELSFRSLKR